MTENESTPAAGERGDDTVLRNVGRRLQSDSARALWEEIRSELRSGGTARVKGHLDDVLKSREQRVRDVLERLRDMRKS